ncbi:MAG TPA: HU family DNA-binding protein, partial [Puia sp.]|nr:HU family DNA-binding protein [Puia sp.]
GINKKQATAALDSFTDTIAKTLKKGDKVTLVGFGTFSVSKRAARTGRNPQTGAAIKIKAKKVAKFKAGAILSSKV